MPTESRLSRLARQHRRQATDAYEELVAALAAASLVLPSAGIGTSSSFTGEVLVELGGARPDVVQRIAELIWRGLRQ
ncbi:hypothetical protein ACWEQL_29870 [Kitasatospora sp. NPDC004240]